MQCVFHVCWCYCRYAHLSLCISATPLDVNWLQLVLSLTLCVSVSQEAFMVESIQSHLTVSQRADEALSHLTSFDRYRAGKTPSHGASQQSLLFSKYTQPERSVASIQAEGRDTAFLFSLIQDIKLYSHPFIFFNIRFPVTVSCVLLKITPRFC